MFSTNLIYKIAEINMSINSTLSVSLSLALSPGDETYHDIFRDFSQMASNNPEKLKRRSADIKIP